jgi:hypothetical protein
MVTVCGNGAMTPLDYEAKYHSLPILLEEMKMTKVDVHRYQNNDAKLKENLFWGNKAALVQKDILIGRMATEAKKMTEQDKAKAKGKTVAGGPTISEGDLGLNLAGALVHLAVPELLKRWRIRMMAVHSGKGSPEEIQVCLHLVAIYGLYDKKKFGTDTAAGVRDYCDKYVGLDCNGYVGNFARELGTGKEPNTPIPSYAPKNKRRTKIEEVQANDVLAWTDNGHIAIIDSIDPVSTAADGKPARDCTVVESTASNPSGGSSTVHGGLQHSTYSIRSVGSDLVFKVERPKGKHRSSVYIAPIA